MTQKIDALLALMVWFKDHHLPFRFCADGSPKGGTYWEYISVQAEHGMIYNVFEKQGCYRITEWNKHDYEADVNIDVRCKEIYEVEIADPDSLEQVARITMPKYCKRWLR